MGQIFCTVAIGHTRSHTATKYANSSAHYSFAAAAAVSRSRFCFNFRCRFRNLSRLTRFTSCVPRSLAARWTPPPHPPAPIFSVNGNDDDGEGVGSFSVAPIVLSPNRSWTVDSDPSITLVTTKYPTITGREKYKTLIVALPSLPRGERIVFCLQYEWTAFLTRSWPSWNRLKTLLGADDDDDDDDDGGDMFVQSSCSCNKEIIYVVVFGAMRMV